MDTDSTLRIGRLTSPVPGSDWRWPGPDRAGHRPASTSRAISTTGLAGNSLPLNCGSHCALRLEHLARHLADLLQRAARPRSAGPARWPASHARDCPSRPASTASCCTVTLLWFRAAHWIGRSPDPHRVKAPRVDEDRHLDAAALRQVGDVAVVADVAVEPERRCPSRRLPGCRSSTRRCDARSSSTPSPGSPRSRTSRPACCSSCSTRPTRRRRPAGRSTGPAPRLLLRNHGTYSDRCPVLSVMK